MAYSNHAYRNGRNVYKDIKGYTCYTKKYKEEKKKKKKRKMTTTAGK